MLAADSEAQELCDEPQLSQTDDLIAAMLILLSGFAVSSSGAGSLGANRIIAAARKHFGRRSLSVQDIFIRARFKGPRTAPSADAEQTDAEKVARSRRQRRLRLWPLIAAARAADVTANAAWHSAMTVKQAARGVAAWARRNLHVFRIVWRAARYCHVCPACVRAALPCTCCGTTHGTHANVICVLSAAECSRHPRARVRCTRGLCCVSRGGSITVNFITAHVSHGGTRQNNVKIKSDLFPRFQHATIGG